MHQHTDLLYSAMWRDGGEAQVYLLFEHQSTPPTEGLMAYRLLRYQDRIWERWRTDHPKAKTLPMIIPIVMYHGVTPWAEPRSFADLLDVPAGVRLAVEPYLVQFTYVLHDLGDLRRRATRKRDQDRARQAGRDVLQARADGRGLRPDPRPLDERRARGGPGPGPPTDWRRWPR